MLKKIFFILCLLVTQTLSVIAYEEEFKVVFKFDKKVSKQYIIWDDEVLRNNLKVQIARKKKKITPYVVLKGKLKNLEHTISLGNQVIAKDQAGSFILQISVVQNSKEFVLRVQDAQIRCRLEIPDWNNLQTYVKNGGVASSHENDFHIGTFVSSFVYHREDSIVADDTVSTIDLSQWLLGVQVGYSKELLQGFRLGLMVNSHVFQLTTSQANGQSLLLTMNGFVNYAFYPGLWNLWIKPEIGYSSFSAFSNQDLNLWGFLFVGMAPVRLEVRRHFRNFYVVASGYGGLVLDGVMPLMPPDSFSYGVKFVVGISKFMLNISWDTLQLAKPAVASTTDNAYKLNFTNLNVGLYFLTTF